MAHDVVFLDCEFTDLQRPQLLSLGLVSGRGQEFYAEYTLEGAHGRALLKSAVGFVHRHVAPFWGRVANAQVAAPAEFGARLAQWLHGLEGTVDVAYDYGRDFDLLEGVLRESGHWAELEHKLQPTHVGYLWGAQAALDAAETYWKQSRAHTGLDRHHALADAHALKAAYLAVHG